MQACCKYAARKNRAAWKSKATRGNRATRGHRENQYVVSASVLEEEIEGVALGKIIDRVKPENVVICEPSKLQIKLGHKGRIEYLLHVNGKTFHSAFPNKFDNTIHLAAKAITALKEAIELDSNNSTALHLYGTMLNQQNSLECVSFYEKSLEINNKSYLTFNGLGNFYLKTNQFEKAENYYSKAIEINPKRSAKIYKNRAYLREKLNKNSDAKEDLKSYLKYFPKAPDRGIIEQAIREI